MQTKLFLSNTKKKKIKKQLIEIKDEKIVEIITIKENRYDGGSRRITYL